jgi:hypothetical protein
MSGNCQIFQRSLEIRLLKGVERMEKKLFRVKVVLYVMAENESEACVAATNARFDIFECAARKADHLDLGWESAIPYNSEDYRTCAEILADQQRVLYSPAPSTPDSGRMRPMLQVHSNSGAVPASPV